MERLILDYLTDHAVLRQYLPGEIIFSQGERAENFYVLLSGLSLTYTVLEDGQERNILITWPGRVFGASTVFEGAARRASAIALKKCRVLQISRELSADCALRFPDFYPELLREISIDLGTMFDQLVDSSLTGSEIRVARFLCRRMTAQQCDMSAETPRLHYTQDFIARVLGLSRYCVNHSLSLLSEKGLISTSYGTVSVLDAAALRRYAYGTAE